MGSSTTMLMGSKWCVHMIQGAWGTVPQLIICQRLLYIQIFHKDSRFKIHIINKINFKSENINIC